MRADAMLPALVPAEDFNLYPQKNKSARSIPPQANAAFGTESFLSGQNHRQVAPDTALDEA